MTTVLITDHAWPDLAIERAVIEGAGFRVVAGSAAPANAQTIASLAREHQPASILTCWAKVDAEAIGASKVLRHVGRIGVGLDNIDVAACEARRIAVFPATGANDLSVAEYVICTAMMLLRRAYRATPEMTTGAWPRNALIGREIAGKVLGLVGFGSISRHTAKLAAGLGMRVVAYDPFARDDAFSAANVQRRELAALLAEADVVSLHVPLTADTRGLIDAVAIAKMKPDAILINAARGGVVDEPAVAAALRAGNLGGAALDVFVQEPLEGANAAVFRDVPGLILTPHIAGVTDESNTRVSLVTVENVKKALVS